MDESVVKHLEVKVGTLKLSEAIRLGAMRRKQCRGDYFANGGSCALGAAWEGAGFNPALATMDRVRDAFNLTFSQHESISNRNDSGWTREAIADFLETQGV